MSNFLSVDNRYNNNSRVTQKPKQCDIILYTLCCRENNITFLLEMNTKCQFALNTSMRAGRCIIGTHMHVLTWLTWRILCIIHTYKPDIGIYHLKVSDRVSACHAEAATRYGPRPVAPLEHRAPAASFYTDARGVSEFQTDEILPRYHMTRRSWLVSVDFSVLYFSGPAPQIPRLDAPPCKF